MVRGSRQCFGGEGAKNRSTKGLMICRRRLFDAELFEVFDQLIFQAVVVGVGH